MTTTAIAHALAYAKQGIFVGPQWPLDLWGACTCTLRANCTKPGKHPDTSLVPNGSSGYTTDPGVIRHWWKEKPDAGIGIDPERSRIVDVAPDSEHWLAEFRRRGLPPTAAFRSSGPGHEHYLYRLPAGVPAARINRSGEYDIMAAGNSVLPPSEHASGGRREWLTPDPDLRNLPLAPAWVCDELRAVQAERDAKQQANRAALGADPTGDVDLEPPVRLDDDDLRVWRGGRTNRAGDRSGSLVLIGRVLINAGATRRTIVAALAERDITLGWRKYSGRKDAAHQYNRIVDELERTDRERAAAEPEPDPEPQQPAGADLHAECRQREAAIRESYQGIVNRQQAEIAELSSRFEAVRAIAEAPVEQLRPSEKLVGLVIAAEVWSAESREQVGESFEKPSHDVYLPDIGRRAGVGDDLAGRVVKKLTEGERPVFIKSERFERYDRNGQPFLHINRKTGEVKEVPHRVMSLRPTHQRMTDTLIAIAKVAPAQPNPKHGGARKRCEKHPEADTYTATFCGECHGLVDGALPPAPFPQDEGMEEIAPPVGFRTLLPQDEGMEREPSPHDAGIDPEGYPCPGPRCRTSDRPTRRMARPYAGGDDVCSRCSYVLAGDAVAAGGD